MIFRYFLLVLGVTCGMSSYASDSTLVVSQATLIKDFPSASGIVVDQRKLYVVGDDFPWLYTMDMGFNFIHKELIKSYPTKRNGRISKKAKPDFEAMELININGRPSLVILGSGSKTDVREWAFVISQDGNLRIERSLKSLYKQLYQVGGFAGDEKINIEGLASSDTAVYILNRGNSGRNIIFMLPKVAFENYLTSKTDQVKNITAHLVKLPIAKGFEAGLSGATYSPITKSLVFTASVEATGNAYNDGEILGSFVGHFPVDKLVGTKALDLTHYSQLLLKEGNPIITKVESVTIVSSDGNKINGLLASDNDNGTSEFFSFSIL